jgi:hypothetical protein
MLSAYTRLPDVRCEVAWLSAVEMPTLCPKLSPIPPCVAGRLNPIADRRRHCIRPLGERVRRIRLAGGRRTVAEIPKKRKRRGTTFLMNPNIPEGAFARR